MTADILMTDYLYVYIVLVSSELDFRRGQTNPRGENKSIPEGDTKIPEVEGQTEPTPKVGPKRD